MLQVLRESKRLCYKSCFSFSQTLHYWEENYVGTSVTHFMRALEAQTWSHFPSASCWFELRRTFVISIQIKSDSSGEGAFALLHILWNCHMTSVQFTHWHHKKRGFSRRNVFRNERLQRASLVVYSLCKYEQGIFWSISVFIDRKQSSGATLHLAGCKSLAHISIQTPMKKIMERSLSSVSWTCFKNRTTWTNWPFHVNSSLIN